MENFRQKNMATLDRHRPGLAQVIRNYAPQPAGTIIPGANGLPNLIFSTPGQPRIMAYQTENPWDEAAGHLQTISPGANGLAVFFGLGLGYGALLVLQQRPELQQIVILEPSLDLFATALQVLDLQPLLSNPKVALFIGPTDWEAFQATASNTALSEDIFLLNHKASHDWAPQLYTSVKERAFAILSQLSIAGATAATFGETYVRNRLDNLSLRRHFYPLDLLRNRFKNMPAVLVASGPSLNRSLPILKKLQGRCLLIAADGALAPLLNNDIIPDIVTAVDIKEFSLEKVAPFLNRPWPFSLVGICRLTPTIPKRLPARHLFFTKENYDAEAWLHEALGLKQNVPPATAVALLSMGVAKIIGADPIIFVGLDLAYPPSASQHASGVINARPGYQEDTFPVPGVNGTTVMTDRALIDTRTKLEESIRNHQGQIFNTSEIGAHIAGTKILTLEEAAARYCTEPLATANMIEKAIAQSGPRETTGLRQVLLRTLEQIAAMEQQISATAQTVKTLQNSAKKLTGKKGTSTTYSVKLQKLKRQVDTLHQANSQIANLTSLWFQVFELVHTSDREHDLLLAECERLKGSGDYLKWLEKELERLDFTYQVRQKALDFYKPLLHRLHTYLTREEALCPAGLNDIISKDQMLALAELYLEAGNYWLAHQVATQGLKRWANEPLLHYRLGLALMNQFDFNTAEQEFQQAATLLPSLTPVIAADKITTAGIWIEHIEKYGSSRPNLCRQWLGRVLTLASDHHDSLVRLHKLWEKDTAEVERFLTAGKLDLAARHLSSWEAFASARTSSWHTLKTRLLVAQNNPDEAIKHLEKALIVHPEEAVLTAYLARLLLETGRHEEGLAQLRKAVILEPGTAILWEELGETLYMTGDFTGAAYCFEQYHAALPRQSGILAKIGDAYLKTGQFKAAQAAYEKLLASDLEHEGARQGLAIIRHANAGNTLS